MQTHKDLPIQVNGYMSQDQSGKIVGEKSWSELKANQKEKELGQIYTYIAVILVGLIISSIVILLKMKGTIWCVQSGHVITGEGKTMEQVNYVNII